LLLLLYLVKSLADLVAAVAVLDIAVAVVVAASFADSVAAVAVLVIACIFMFMRGSIMNGTSTLW
jgi:large-conductance mechanosensitive channel